MGRAGERPLRCANGLLREKIHIHKSMYGPTKTPSGVREVLNFGYFKQFPKVRAGIAKALFQGGVGIHSLRNTFAYFLKSNDLHVTEAAKFLGHSCLMMTEKI